MQPRRAFASGVAVGIAGGLVLALVELLWIAKTAYGYFDGAGELSRFALGLFGVLAGAGLLVGVVEGGVAEVLARAFPRRIPSLAWSALALPAVAWVSEQLFRGNHARTIPGHQLYAVAIALGLFALVHAAVVAWRALYARVPSSPRLGWALASAALAGVLAAYVGDQRILPRLYPWFHVGLSLVAFTLAQALVATLARARGAGPSRAQVIALVLAGALGGVAGVAGFAEARGLRTLALERTAPLGRLLALAHRLTPQPRENAAPPQLAEPTRRPSPAGPRLGAADVFLITVDAMRADRLTRDVAPTMRALADRGIDFTHAYAQVPHTSFSVATLLTGKHVYSLSALGLDAASHETLAQIMKRERYKTAAFYPPSVFFIDHDRLKGLESSSYGFEYVKYEYLPADARTDQVLRFFDEEKPARAFVWVHYLEPHEPYDVHPGVTRGDSTLARYEGEIRFVDLQIARLIDFIRQQRPRALVILAADHGEEFGEHGGHYHGTTLYEEQVRVPLAFTLINDETLDPARIEEPVGLVDVAPTVLALLGVEPSLRMRGQDLSPLFSRATSASLPLDSLPPQLAEIDRKKMLVAGKEKLICDLENDACQAFDLARDPGEQHPITSGAGIANLRARLQAWMAAETRFEAERAAAAGPARRTLERARLGDRAVTVELAGLLRSPDKRVRLQAAQLLASLPPDPSVRAALEEARTDPALALWAELGLSRLGDAAARAQVNGFVGTACAGDDVALCARAALALADPKWEAQALERAGLDEPLTIALAHAIGATHDPSLLASLLPAMGPVRTRADVVEAIAELGAPEAVAPLLRWLPAEPYIPVRAKLVRALARLGPHDPEVRRALTEASTSEREPVVVHALVDALAWLGAPSVAPIARAQSSGAGELWLVGEGAGELAVTVAGVSTEVSLQGGVARVETRKVGAVSLRVPDGSAARPRLAFWRPSPKPPTP